jgi:N-acyl-D-aspartate/D-glutamate deacylase
MLDLVIKGGTVVDGSGLPAYRADVGVKDGRITAMGRVRETAKETVDAEGLTVTPGFIDGHTHMDAQINWDPLGTCSCWHGVTTVMMGNCGFTLAPSHKDRRDLVVRNLERAEAISPDAMAKGINWSWETFPEYLDVVEALPKGINYGAYVGHSALRTWAMGERAFSEKATDDDLARMKTHVQESLRAGAIGFSTSRSMHHQTADDRPVASRLAAWDEVRALVKTLGEMGAGVFELAQEEVARKADPEAREEYFNRVCNLAVESGVPITYGIFPQGETRDGWEGQLSVLDRAAARGGRVFGQSHTRGPTIILSFRTQLPFDRLPGWAAFRKQPHDEQLRQLRHPEVRQRLVAEATGATYAASVGAEARPPDFDTLYVFDRALPPYDSVAAVAQRRGMNPVEAMIDMAVAADFNLFFFQQTGRYSEDDVLKIMRHPRTVMTFSDSGAHVNQIIDASIQTLLLAYWVRQKQAFTLEEAIRMLTLSPAVCWGLADRGMVRPGMVADLNVIDMDALKPGLPKLVHDLPAGAERLILRASGFAATIVGGQVVLRNGVHTGALPGRLIRGPLAARR